MPVDAIDDRNAKLLSGTSYIGAALTGAVSGYALKWAIPLTRQEKDETYAAGMSQSRRDYWVARKSEIEEIRKSKNKIECADLFIKLNDENKLTLAQIQKAKAPVYDKLMILFNRINEVGLVAKIEGKRIIKIRIKDLRPTFVFILLGTGFGLGIALIKNIAKNLRELNYQD